MTRWALLAIPALCLSALAACGSSPGPAAFLNATASEVLFLQWQPGSGNSIEGMLTDDTLSTVDSSGRDGFRVGWNQ